MRLRGMPATLWYYREAMARALGVLASTMELLTPRQPTVDDEAAMGVTLIQFQVTVAALSNDSVDPGSASFGRTSSATGTLRQYSSCVREKARRTGTGKGSEGHALQTTCRSLQLQCSVRMARPRNGRGAARHNRTATKQ
jgi:hypothetical protein